MFCIAVVDLPESQGRTSETPQQDVAITHSHVEIGRDNRGLHQEVAQDDTLG